jgi:hypothetical protein
MKKSPHQIDMATLKFPKLFKEILVCHYGEIKKELVLEVTIHETKPPETVFKVSYETDHDSQIIYIGSSILNAIHLYNTI